MGKRERETHEIAKRGKMRKGNVSATKREQENGEGMMGRETYRTHAVVIV